jgi:DNA-directed RNA polymerase subunit RPC12/RpoP
MAHYTVFCEDCGSEYTVAGLELRDPPSTCTFCGSKL